MGISFARAGARRRRGPARNAWSAGSRSSSGRPLGSDVEDAFGVAIVRLAAARIDQERLTGAGHDQSRGIAFGIDPDVEILRLVLPGARSRQQSGERFVEAKHRFYYPASRTFSTPGLAASSKAAGALREAQLLEIIDPTSIAPFMRRSSAARSGCSAIRPA